MRRLSLLLVCFAGCLCQPPPPFQDAGVDAGDPGAIAFHLEAFGAVLRGDFVERTGTFSNSRSEAVAVSALTVTGASFSLVGPTSLLVSAGGEATTQVRFAPVDLGPHSGTLTFQTTATTGTQTTTFDGLGIGPSLELMPEHLEFGTLPLYDGAPVPTSMMLTVRNAGLDGTPPRLDTALAFYFDVQSTSAALPGELCVGDCMGTPFQLDVDALTMVPVVLTSTSPGLKTWDVRVFSNDPTAPMRTVRVTADVVARPTCQFALPSALAFGVLTSPERRELEVLFENVGTDVCEVSRVEVGPETPAPLTPLFSVVNGPIGQTLAPGEVLQVIVRASPQGPPPVTPLTVRAQLRLEINHPDGFARVPLTADLELSCLGVTPTPVDFGSVQTGCRSADRPVMLRNGCARPLTVTSATLPGFSSFSVSGALPRTLAQNETVSLTTRYTPFAVGPVRDVIDASWLDGAVTKHTTVPLLGEANTTGENTDRFPPLPRADQGTLFPLRATPDPLGALPLAVTVAGQDVSPATDGGMLVWAWESAPNAVRFTTQFAPAPTALVEISYPVACAP